MNSGSGGLAGMLGCDRNLDPLKITGPSVDKFGKITLLILKISMFKRIEVTEMKIKSYRKKTFQYCLPGALWLGGTAGNFSVGPFQVSLLKPGKYLV